MRFFSMHHMSFALQMRLCLQVCLRNVIACMTYTWTQEMRCDAREMQLVNVEICTHLTNYAHFVKRHEAPRMSRSCHAIGFLKRR